MISSQAVRPVFSFNRVIKNLVAIFVGDIVSRLMAMATAIILARYLGPEDYGKYSLVLSVAYIFVILSDFGLNDLIIRDVAKDHSVAPKYLSASLTVKPLLSLVSIILLILFVYLAGYSREIFLCTVIYSLHILFITMTNSISSIFRGFQRMEYVSLIAIVNGVVGLLFIAVLIYWDGTLLEIIFSRVLTLFVGFMVGFIILTRMVKFDFSVDILFLKRHLVSAFPFLTIGIIHTLYLKVDIMMLSKLKGDLYVGWFTAAANDLFFSLFVIPAAVSAVTYPIFSRHYAESIERLRTSCNFTVKILAILGVPISAGTFVLAPQIIRSIFGPEYDNSIVVLQVISLAISFIFVRDPFGYGLAAVGKVKTLMWSNGAFLILNVVLNAIMIPLYAHIGAAVTSLFCIFLSMLVGQYLLNIEIKGIYLGRHYLKPIIAALIMSAIIYFIRDSNLFVVIFMGAIVYFLLLFLLKTFNPSELLILKGLLKRSEKSS